MEKPDRIVLIVCPNHGLADGNYPVVAIEYNSDTFLSPPQEFIDLLIDTFRERNGGEIMKLRYEHCSSCTGRTPPTNRRW